MTSQPPLTFAIAGFGWWGQHMARRLKDNSAIRVAGIIEPDQAKNDLISELGLAQMETLDEALIDPAIDAIVLTTPNIMHEDQVVACAGAGKHVFCEKPLSLTGASARRAVEACKTAGVMLGIGHERRFEPALLAVREMVSIGDLGTIMHAEAAFSHDKLIGVPSGDWRTRKETAPAAGMTGMGIHLTDLLISLFGPVKIVQALTSKRVLDWETGDVVSVQLGFVSGMTATLSAILYTPHFIRLHVFGSEKWVEVRNHSHPDTPGGKTDMIVASTADGQSLTHFDWSDTVVANLEAFAAAINGDADYPFTHQEMVHNIEVLEAIAQSAEQGETVYLS